MKAWREMRSFRILMRAEMTLGMFCVILDVAALLTCRHLTSHKHFDFRSKLQCKEVLQG